ISFRHPDDPELMVMGRHTPAATITEADLLTLNMKGEVVEGTGSAVGERLVHAGMYLARPDVQVVCHSHTPSLIPFGVTGYRCGPCTSGQREWAPTYPSGIRRTNLAIRRCRSARWTRLRRLLGRWAMAGWRYYGDMGPCSWRAACRSWRCSGSTRTRTRSY
ncbi:MAG: hypothetical protein GEU75_09210, partial [Dehalococcoidia bacterium]|nr:hypothetical protein [Dehalococcoidia bacterium]